MSDTTGKTTDATATTDATTADADTQAAADKGKVYTKAELDGIRNKAVAQARREYADYGDLKATAEEYDKLQESTRSNEDKLRGAHDRAVRERDAALTRANQSIIRSAIIAAASRLGVVDPEAVAALLPQSEIVLEGDEVIGVDEAVEALLAKKPYLRQRGAQRAGAELQGGGAELQTYTRSQIREWLRTGQMTPERQKAVDEAYKAGRVRMT